MTMPAFLPPPALRSVAVAAFALGVSGASAQALSAAQLYARLEPSVWVVRTFDKDQLPLGQGSAVVVGPETLVTNCHVLRKGKRVEVTHAKVVATATLELWDTVRDLCQLRAPGVNAPAVMLATEPVIVGQTVYALGAPAGLELTLSAGLISALRRDDSERLTAIQTSAAISPGSSGGGLFDDQGRLIGITTAFVGGNAQNLNLALPVAMVRELPERHAAAQASKAAPAKAAAPASVAGTLAGLWSGEFRCGAYLGTGSVPNAGGWNVTAMMTVRSDGNATIVRGDSSYSESLVGDVQPDRSATLKGRGAMKSTPGSSWNTEVVGRFVGVGNADRFEGHGQIGSATGEVSRHCTVLLTKNAAL